MDENQWHIKKEVSVGHMISTGLLAAGLIGVYADMSSNIQRNSLAVEHIKELHVLETQRSRDSLLQMEIRSKEGFRALTEQFEHINKKLDKLIERELNGK